MDIFLSPIKIVVANRPWQGAKEDIVVEDSAVNILCYFIPLDLWVC